LNMHRAKPSLKKGMKSWLDSVWVCNKDWSLHRCKFSTLLYKWKITQ
jgi:hypothetical protein